MSLQDLNYIAGFLDADGSIIAQFVKKQDYKWGFGISFTVQLSLLSERKIYMDKIKDIIGVGYVRVRSKNSKICDYVLTDTKLVHAFLKEIVPYLRVKKRQADLVITIIERLPNIKKDLEQFKIVAALVDQVSGLNDSKNRTLTGDYVISEITKKIREKKL